MKIRNYISAVTLAASFLLPGVRGARAEDDNVFDGKGYTGGFCKPALGDYSSSTKHIAWGPSGYINLSTSDQAVNPEGTFFSRVSG